MSKKTATVLIILIVLVFGCWRVSQDSFVKVNPGQRAVKPYGDKLRIHPMFPVWYGTSPILGTWETKFKLSMSSRRGMNIPSAFGQKTFKNLPEMCPVV